jgi:hypothetical protein
MSGRDLPDPLAHEIGNGPRAVTSPGNERKLDVLPVPEPLSVVGDLGHDPG